MNRKNIAGVWILVWLFSIAVVPSALAFGGKSGFDPAKKSEKLQRELSLSDDQTAQVRSILESSKAEMQALRQRTQARVEAVLTEEQREKLRANQKSLRDKFKEKMGLQKS